MRQREAFKQKQKRREKLRDIYIYRERQIDRQTEIERWKEKIKDMKEKERI